MPWTVRWHQDESVVETVYAGTIAMDELREAIFATVAAGKERQGKRYLSDCRLLEAGGSLADVYDLPALYESLGLGRDWTEAIVLPVRPRAEDELKFYETVTRNRGYRVRIFSTRDEALAWLTGGGPAPVGPG